MEGPPIVLVALTGWGQDEDKRRSWDAGFDHHLTKPPEPDVVQRLIAGCRSD
jgi:CheY-like chemotaxis protein